MDLSQPLSDDEFDELDRFLVSEGTPEECMDISMLDGFLTAVVIGPNLILPSRWLPLVWGETPEQPMRWESPQQAERMTGLVMRHMNDIAWLLKEDTGSYEPILLEGDHEGETVTIIDEWCTGFMEGAMLDGEAWAPLFESGESDSLVLPMMLYGTESGWQELERNPELEQRHEEFAESLADRVLAIQDYWLPVRKAKSTIRHAEPAPGRNDPCPCGSGKKFKKCCGGAAKPD
jgi:uncharacterized protein